MQNLYKDHETAEITSADIERYTRKAHKLRSEALRGMFRGLFSAVSEATMSMRNAIAAAAATLTGRSASTSAR